MMSVSCERKAYDFSGSDVIMLVCLERNGIINCLTGPIERREVPSGRGSLIHLANGTDLIRSREEGGIYLLIGQKTRVKT